MADSAQRAQVATLRSGGVAAVRALATWPRAAVALSLLFLFGYWIDRPYVGGDTPFVLDGTNAFIDCLSRQDYVGCRYSGKLDYWGLTSPIGDWPLLQHLPDLLLVELGVNGHPDRTRVLALLSVAGFAAGILFGRVVLYRVGQGRWFWGFVVVLLSSPIIAYARTTAGETLAMGLLVCLVAATVLRAPPALVALAAAAACVTKETSYLFVAALGVLGLLLAQRRTGEPIRRHLAWGAGGIAVAIVAASLFNVVRFGSVLNSNYLEPVLHTPGILRKLDYALALAVSPNGGVAIFWPAATAVLLAACLVPLRASWRDRLPALVLAGVVIVLTLGFASWWTPFGWGGYGPRFALPWVPALVLLALAAYGEPLATLARRLLVPRWRLLAVFAAIAVLTLPHVGVMWDQQATHGFFADNPHCDAPWRIGVDEYHACQHRLIWYSRPLPIYAAGGVASAGAAVAAVAVFLGLLGSLVLLREQLVSGTGTRSGSSAGSGSRRSA